MRIVDLKEFLALPSPQLFIKCGDNGEQEEPLSIKLESIFDSDRNQNIDFFYLSLVPKLDPSIKEYFTTIDAMINNSTISHTTEFVIERDGLFDEYQKYMIFDIAEFNGLISILQKYRNKIT